VLAAHAGTHAAAVYIVTGSWQLAVAEWALHCLIDAAKCANLTNIHKDQALHVACKVLWAVIR
jgi:hypothetical protein